MDPASSDYNLDGLPNSWEDAVGLRPILENLYFIAPVCGGRANC